MFLILQCQTVVSAVSQHKMPALQQAVPTAADYAAKWQHAEKKSEVQPWLWTRYLAAFTFFLPAF